MSEAERQSVFSCPLCGKNLSRNKRSYRCPSGHCFDIAKEGYVNLLPANRQHSSAPGDDREMVKARTMFLDGGWYAPLREALCRTASAAAKEGSVLLDAGCGEGYYTEALNRLFADGGGRTGGIDLSRTAVRKAAKRCFDAEIAVASVYHLPLADGSVDLLTDCFSPLAAEEFFRVLKLGGGFLYVVPGPRHLWEMKEILYERPYEKDVREEEYEGFRLKEWIPLDFRFRLRKTEDIAALFRMTPYFWKSPREGAERLAKIQELDLTAQFRIFIYEKS